MFFFAVDSLIGVLCFLLGVWWVNLGRASARGFSFSWLDGGFGLGCVLSLSPLAGCNTVVIMNVNAKMSCISSNAGSRVFIPYKGVCRLPPRLVQSLLSSQKLATHATTKVPSAGSFLVDEFVPFLVN